MLDLTVSIGFNPRHNKKMQSFSSIDSNLKKPDMFRQKTLGRRMGFRQSFQGVKLWRGSYFWETCFSVFANLGNLLYCLLSVHNVKVVFTTIKLEICFWKGEKRFESTMKWVTMKKVLSSYSTLTLSNLILPCHTKWCSGKVLILEVPRDVTQQRCCVTSEYLYQAEL